MHPIARSALLLITALVLAACLPIPSSPTPSGGTPPALVGIQLSKSANTQTYSQVGQVITYTYVITNSGTRLLGPDQFTISDNRLGAPFPCGPAATMLGSHQSLSCTASYTISQAHMNLSELTNRATASGGGQTSAPASVTIINLALSGTQGFGTETPSPSLTLVPGMTVQHEVMEGEWLSQIARCYGANLSAVQNANPEITDPEAPLAPPLTLTIPDIGSDERVHGPPCLAYYTVEAGDTWESIASRYLVDVLVLQDANRDVTLTSGVQLRVPLSSPGHLPYPPGYNAATAQRIEITAASSPLALAGIVPPSSRVWYVVTLPETHIFSLRLTGAPDTLRLAVYDTHGDLYNPTGGSLTWTGFIPATGDYYIEVTEVSGAALQSYVLQASLTIFVSSPTPPPAGTSSP
jgi:LysM repeat protein